MLYPQEQRSEPDGEVHGLLVGVLARRLPAHEGPSRARAAVVHGQASGGRGRRGSAVKVLAVHLNGIIRSIAPGLTFNAVPLGVPATSHST